MQFNFSRYNPWCFPGPAESMPWIHKFSERGTLIKTRHLSRYRCAASYACCGHLVYYEVGMPCQTSYVQDRIFFIHQACTSLANTLVSFQDPIIWHGLSLRVSWSYLDSFIAFMNRVRSIKVSVMIGVLCPTSIDDENGRKSQCAPYGTLGSG